MQRAPDTRRQRNRRRVIFVIIAALAAISSTLWQPGDRAAASAGEEAAFVAALNEVRANHGLPPFTVNAELSNLSRGHSQVMADSDGIFHASPISQGYGGPWQKLGENVGRGANVQVLVDAFIASPGHFANIIDPSFTQIGVGVVHKDPFIYTTHRFLQLPGDTPTTTAPPAPVTTAPPSIPTTTAPTTTTVPPLPEPAISAERVRALLDMLELVGT